MLLQLAEEQSEYHDRRPHGCSKSTVNPVIATGKLDCNSFISLYKTFI